MTRIVVAMSGGVDSSVAAALLVEQGFEVIGMTMQLWDYGARKSGHAGRCCASEDIEDARRVAHHLKIPFYAINFQKEFGAKVVRPFMEDYLGGRTPSPCVHCNSDLKFRELVKVANKLRADQVATGHYARVQYDPAPARYQLLKAKDRQKDQSYFLFDLTQDQLRCAVFPLGNLTKSEVRELARQKGLPVAEKAESQELCFLQGEQPGQFIQRHIPKLSTVGRKTDSAGHDLGEHAGVQHFTIGQRRGLGIAAGEPRYVTELDPSTQRVAIGTEHELMRSAMQVERVNWVSIPDPEGEISAHVRIRYRHEESPATIQPNGKDCRVEFSDPQRAITPGQATVFYNGEVILGGGWIRQTP